MSEAELTSNQTNISAFEPKVGEAHTGWEDAVRWLTQQPEYSQFVLDCYYDKSVLGTAVRFSKGEEWKAAKRWLPESVGRSIDVNYAPQTLSSLQAELTLRLNTWED